MSSVKAVRGQSALEYMMTYGWAILVVLIAGILVWQMGLLNISQNVSPDKRGFSQVTPLDWELSEDGSFVVVIQNNAGSILNLDSAGAILVVGGQGECAAPAGLPINGFRPASTQKINFANCQVNRKTGEYYRVNMTITYTNPASGLQHVSNGIIWGPIG